MYKLYYQLDRQRKAEDEEEKQPSVNERNGGLLSEKYQRDSYSTISTQETEIILTGAALPPVTWGEGNLPMEIAVPGYSSSSERKMFVTHSIAKLSKSSPYPLLTDDGEGTNQVFPTQLTSLLVDDEEDLNMIFTDSSYHVEESTQQDQQPNEPMVDDEILSSSASECESDDDDVDVESSIDNSITSESADDADSSIDDSTTIHPPLAPPQCLRYTSAGTLETVDSDSTPDGMIRFELKGFTRFEI